MAKRVKTNYDRGYVNAMDKIRVFIESSSKVMYKQKGRNTMALYNTCKRMIERGQTAGMAKKLDIFYAANKLTDEQYAELTEMLNEKDSAEKADQ